METGKLKIENALPEAVERSRRVQKEWVIMKLGEVCKLINGKAYSKKELLNYGKYKVLRVGNFFTNNNWYYSDLELPENKYCNKGDLLYAWSASFGPIIWNENNTIYHYHIWKVNFNKEILDKYFLFHWFNWDVNKIKQEQGAGTTMVHVSMKSMNGRSIPIPPLPEQKRIVKILDKAFTAIGKAKENAEKNLQNAKELFESYLNGIFVNGKLKVENGEWEEKRFDEVCVLQRGFDLPTRLRQKGKFPLVSSNGITDSINKWKVKTPGVVTGRSGTIGKIHFIKEDFWPLNTALYIKDFKGNYERYIYYFLQKFDLSKYQSGAGVPTLNRNNVHSVIVLFPKSIEKQKQIVRKLDTLQTETKRLEKIYQQKITDVEELKKSILQKAFEGEL